MACQNTLHLMFDSSVQLVKQSMMGNLIEGFREIKQNHINLLSFGQGLG
jgi:hypothetical protein